MLSTLAFLFVSIPFDVPNTTEVQHVKILIQPDSMELARARLKSGKLPLGLWKIVITGPPGRKFSKEELEQLAPGVNFLSKEDAIPILMDKSGGHWKQAAHYLMLAGALAPGGLGAARISTNAIKWIGAGMAGIELLRKDLESKTPDITSVLVEIPTEIIIPSSGGITLRSWAGKVKGAHVYSVILP